MRLGKTKSSDLGPACLIHFCTASRSRGRDLELNRVLSLVLHDHGARRYLLAMADVPDLEADQIAAASLAVGPQVEEGQLTHLSLSLNGAFWPTILPLFHGSRWSWSCPVLADGY